MKKHTNTPETPKMESVTKTLGAMTLGAILLGSLGSLPGFASGVVAEADSGLEAPEQNALSSSGTCKTSDNKTISIGGTLPHKPGTNNASGLLRVARVNGKDVTVHQAIGTEAIHLVALDPQAQVVISFFKHTRLGTASIKKKVVAIECY